MLALLFLSLLIALRCYPSLDPDLGWHLFLGKKIAETDWFVSNFVGYNVFSDLIRPDHEWLSNLLLYLCIEKIGYWFIWFVFLLLLILTVFAIRKTVISKIKTENSVSTTGSLLLFLASVDVVFGVRLQFLMLLFAALLQYIGYAVKDYRLRLIFYALVFLIGNNLHGGIISLMPIPLLLELSYAGINQWKKGMIKAAILLLLILVVLSINPYGLEYWKLMSNYLVDDFYKSHIAEWQPIFLIVPFDWAGIIFPLATLVFFFGITKQWKRMNIFELILLSLYFYLGIKHVRQFPTFILIALPYFASALEYFQNEIAVPLKKPVAIATFILILPLFIPLFKVIPETSFSFIKEAPFNDPGYPTGGVKYLEENKAEGNLFNDYVWGGFILWKYPNLPIFVDGRGPEKFVNEKDTVLSEYLKFYSEDQKTIKEKLDQYGISQALIKRELTPPELPWIDRMIIRLSGTDFQKKDTQKNNLLRYLESNDSWHKKFEDDISVIYERKS